MLSKSMKLPMVIHDQPIELTAMLWKVCDWTIPVHRQ